MRWRVRVFQCSETVHAPTETARYGYKSCAVYEKKRQLIFMLEVQAFSERRCSLCPSDIMKTSSDRSNFEMHGRPVPTETGNHMSQRALVWMEALSDRDDTQSSSTGDSDVPRTKTPSSATLSEIGEEHGLVRLMIRNPGNEDWSPNTDSSSLSFGRLPDERLLFKDSRLQPMAEPELLLSTEPQCAECSSSRGDCYMSHPQLEAIPNSACTPRGRSYPSLPLETANMSLGRWTKSRKTPSDCPIESSSSREVPLTESLPVPHADLIASSNHAASPIKNLSRQCPHPSDELFDSRNEVNPRGSILESQATRGLSLDSVRYPSLDDGDSLRPPTLVSYTTASQATETSTPETCSLIESTTAAEIALRAPFGMMGETLSRSNHARSPMQNTSRSLLSLNTDVCKPNWATGNSRQRPKGRVSEQSKEAPPTPTSPSSRTSSDYWSDRLARSLSGRRLLNPFKRTQASDSGQDNRPELPK